MRRVQMGLFLVLLLLARFWTGSAQALPSYARQTGQQCAACHNGFPELTPYGRLFKLNGYTFGGGQSTLPPFAVMLIPSYTATRGDQPGGAAPHVAANNNSVFQTGSLFYGGALTPDAGAFIQATYDNVGRKLTWDNTDIRYAGTGRIDDKTLIWGVSANNNPGVTDVWNSTPAWGYPYLTSSLAPTPAAHTALEGSYAQQVVGINGYTLWNRLIYAEFGAYSTLTNGIDSGLGVSPTGTSAVRGLAPYWRFAIEPQWGANSWEFGTFGLAAAVNPSRMTGDGADHLVDIGLDTQYQFLGERDSVSVDASFINENQSLTASHALGLASNSRDRLQSLHVKASYYYQQTYGLTAGYFQVQGNADAALYGDGSANATPNSDGTVLEADFIPFNHGGPAFWPWLNVKFGLQYIYYDKFNGLRVNYDGNGRNAHDNNTLYLFSWLAF